MQRTKIGGLFDDVVGAAEQGGREGDAERLGGLEIDDQLDFRTLLDRQVGRLLAIQGPADVNTDLTIGIPQTGSVNYQASVFDGRAFGIYPRNTMVNCESNHLIKPGIKERVSGVKKCTGLQLDQGCFRL